MFKINELLVYGNEGVCRVDDIRTLDMMGVDKDRLYYVLIPLYGNGKIYTPVDTNIYMRPVITYERVQKLIEQIPNMKVAKVSQNNNFRELNDYYKSLIDTHNCEDLLELIRTIYVKKCYAESNKKKLGRIDKEYMKMAEDLLYGEFSAALEIPKEDVENYIIQKLNDIEKDILC